MAALLQVHDQRIMSVISGIHNTLLAVLSLTNHDSAVFQIELSQGQLGVILHVNTAPEHQGKHGHVTLDLDHFKQLFHLMTPQTSWEWPGNPKPAIALARINEVYLLFTFQVIVKYSYNDQV